MSENTDRAAWVSLLPEASSAIAKYYTPGEQVGDNLAHLLAYEVLNVAYRRRADLRAGARPNPHGSAS